MQSEQTIYKELRAFIEFDKGKENILEILSEPISQRRLLEILEVLSDSFQFLKYDYNSLSHFVTTENMTIEDIHVNRFIEELQGMELYEDARTFVFPDFKMAMFQQKLKRALNIISKIPLLIARPPN